MSFQKDIFICSSSQDIKEAMEVVAFLEKNGDNCWISARDLSPDSSNYWDDIVAAIQQCKIFLILCSEASMHSIDVQNELKIASNFKKKNIELKLDYKTPSIISSYPFSQTNSIESKNGLDTALLTYLQETVSNLIKSIKSDERVKNENAAIINNIDKTTLEKWTSLGKQYLNGNGVEKNETEAVKWFRKAAEQGNINAQYQLMKCYTYGLGVEQNDSESIKLLKKVAETAEKGGAETLYQLGECYENDLDFANAAEWFQKAAVQGNTNAQYNLGYYYNCGFGVKQDYTEAVKWFRKSADQGNANAQCSLGVCYYDGKGLTQDYTEAVKWYIKAANQGNDKAQCNLGMCYYDGTGVKQNYVEAVKWFKKAADQGNDIAQNNLGYCYMHIPETLQDFHEAVKWFEKAAKQGNADAQCNLGLCYEGGMGVEQDYIEAIKWYQKAVDQGFAMIQDHLKELKDKINAPN